MTSILNENCSIKPELYKNDGSMTRKVSTDIKKKILDFLYAPEPGLIGDMQLIDPITRECYSNENEIRESDGFRWNTAIIYMFEKYDIMLSDKFMNRFIKS